MLNTLQPIFLHYFQQRTSLLWSECLKRAAESDRECTTLANISRYWQRMATTRLTIYIRLLCCLTLRKEPTISILLKRSRMQVPGKANTNTLPRRADHQTPVTCVVQSQQDVVVFDLFVVLVLLSFLNLDYACVG